MEPKVKARLGRVAVNVCRLLLAVTFIFSGFVKAVDPMGSFFKISDYLAAFGMGGILPDFALTIVAIALSSLEFILGVNILLAIRRRITTIITFIFMVVMTTLTLYLAVENPVPDCGCFGDALLLTNWQTFAKNVVLLAAATIAMLHYDKMFRVMTWRVQWIVTTYSLCFIIAMSVYCLNNLPILDFRPYRVGVNIPEAMSVPDGAELPQYETTFILEKDGERREFTLDEYPDSTWHFVDSRTELVKEGYVPPITDFSVTDYETGEDLTSRILSDTGYTFLLLIYDISKADDTNIDRVNDVYDYCKDNGYPFYCLTASSGEYIEYWRDYMGADYDFCMTDATTLKTIIRSNPGLMLIKDGTIIAKWHHKHLPTEYDLGNSDLSLLPIGQLDMRDDAMTMLWVVMLYLIPLTLIIGIESIWLRANGIRQLD